MSKRERDTQQTISHSKRKQENKAEKTIFGEADRQTDSHTDTSRQTSVHTKLVTYHSQSI